MRHAVRYRRSATSLLALSLRASACSSTATVADDQMTPAPTTSTTLAPVTTTTVPVSGDSSIDLVVVGDSFVGWSDWPEMYADLASDSLGVTVVVEQSMAGS